MIKRMQAVAVAGAIGAVLVAAPTAANAGVGSYCGHGSGQHYHGLTFNSYTYYSSRTAYDGSYLRHTHTYLNAYVSFGQGWESRETKGCALH
jgi:hypothetical protein